MRMEPGGDEDVARFETCGDSLEVRRSISGAYFVRLYGKYACPRALALTQP